MTERKKIVSNAFRAVKNSVSATKNSKGDASAVRPNPHVATSKPASRSEAALDLEGVTAVAKRAPRAHSPTGKGEVQAPFGQGENREFGANTTVAPEREGRKSKGIGTRQVEVNPVSTPGIPGKPPGASGVAAAPASAGVVKSGADAGSALNAPASEPPGKLAAPRAAPASAKSDRDEQNGEQKAMKTNTNRHGFKLNEFVVYPAHGVGQVVSIEEQEVAGFKLELFVINFVKDKMTLRVPTSKVAAVGMRKLSDADAARRSLEILTGRARVKRTMWSRRAQEYEAKINSGDINEQSYSERQLYEAALDRMMREIAAVHKVTETEALKMIDGQLKKNAKRAPKAETPGAEAEAEDADIEEAA
jgi:CarD family transcriptional regulator